MRLLLPYLLISASLVAGWVTAEWVGEHHGSLTTASETPPHRAAPPEAIPAADALAAADDTPQ